ncbi:MAG: carbon-nitrogen hydrolase family protein [Methanomassiliicoccales archaeon]
MRIALVQSPCALGDKRGNVDRMAERIGETEADLFVFCEAYLTGYMVRDRFPVLADEGDLDRVISIAEEHDCHILFGAPMWDQEIHGVLKNCAIAVSPRGQVQRYDKIFLANFGPFEEKIHFGQGDRPALFEFGDMRFGVCICYDVFFPELSKHYAMRGAHGLICISAAPVTSRPLFERVLPARAAENTMYSIYVNQVGAQLNQVFFGGSQAHGPGGELMTKCDYFAPDTRLVEIDPVEIEMARRSRPTLRDTLSSPWNPWRDEILE